MKRAWEFLAAWWMDGATDAGFPVSPGGQVPTLQSDGRVVWSESLAGLSGVVESGAMVYEDGSPVND